jgi:hypothetical protein
MIGAAVEDFRMQIGAGMIDESAEEIFEKFGLQVANMNDVYLLIVDQRRTPA